MKIDADYLTREVNKLLYEYGDECSRVMDEAIGEVGKEARTKLKQSIKQNFKKGHNKKHYINGWRISYEKSGARYKMVLYNDDQYRLTHLLENGHNIRNGKGATGWVKGKPHIAPVNEWAQEEAVKRIEEKLK